MGLGCLIRRKIRLLQRLYLPSSVIGGLLGLLLLQMLPLPEEATAGWGAKPILAIALSVMLLWGGLLLFLNRGSKT